MSKVIDGYEVEPYAASEVEVGWTILIRGYGLYGVVGRKTKPARREGEDPQLIIQVDRTPSQFVDEAGLTVYKVIRKAPADDAC